MRLRRVGFFAGVAGAEDCGYQDDCGAEFYEEFAAVQPVYGSTLQVGVGEEAVVEEGGGGEIDGEVEGFPCAAAELDAEVGGDDDEGEDVEGDGADGVFEGLLRGMDGVDEIEDAEFWSFVQEQR